MPNHIKNRIELIGSLDDLDKMIKQFGEYYPAELSMTHDGKEVICKGKEDYDFCWLDLSTGRAYNRKELNQIGLPKEYTPEIRDAFFSFPEFSKVIPPPNDPAYRDEPSQDVAKNSPNWWYRWNIDNWGTKWSAYCCKRTAINVFEFETAWASVPIIIERMSEVFPKVTIKYSWADEDTGHNCGRSVYLNGLLETFVPDGGSKDAYDIAFELRPDRVEDYKLVEGNYIYKED